MKGALFCIALFVALQESTVHSQGNGCAIQTCTQRSIGTNLQYPKALDAVQKSRPNSNSVKHGIHGKGKRDTGYGAQNQVIEHGKVIIMPPLGKAPPNSPQPGRPGGGARPEDNPYIAAMAPEDTVPVAIFPPFDRSPEYPTKCVIFSQLTDFEEASLDYGNVQVPYKPTYLPPRVARSLEDDDDDDYDDSKNGTKTLSRQKRQFNFAGLFGPRTPKKIRGHSTSSSSYGPPSYSPPSYAPPTEPPVRIIYRKFGYVCEHTVSIDVCELPKYGQSQQPQQLGQQGQYGQQNQLEPPSKNGYSKADDCNAGNGNRHGYGSNQILTDRVNSQQGQGPIMCNTVQGSLSQCQGAQAEKNQYPGTQG